MKKLVCLLIVATMLFSFISCSIEYVSMPYSSDEYENGEWSVEDLVDHFEELGFEDIEIESVKTDFGEPHDEVYAVLIEDTSTLLTTYTSFKKGEEFDVFRKVKIETTTFVETLKTDNCPEFASYVEMKYSPEKTERNYSTEKDEARKAFLKEHIGEYIEFEGTITNWNDKVSWIEVHLSVAVDDSDQTSFSWDTESSELNIKPSSEYGKIREGAKVHMIAEIVATKKGPSLRIETMEIID